MLELYFALFEIGHSVAEIAQSVRFRLAPHRDLAF